MIGAHGWGGGGPISTDWLRPAWNDTQNRWPLLSVVTKAFHLHVFLSLANWNIQKNLKHSNKTRKSTLVPCSVQTHRAASHRQQGRSELSFTSSCSWTNKYKSQFKHANRKRCERAQFSTSALCSVHTGRTQTCLKSLEHQICLFLLLYRQIHTTLCQNTRLGEYPRKNCWLCLKWN